MLIGSLGTDYRFVNGRPVLFRIATIWFKRCCKRVDGVSACSAFTFCRLLSWLVHGKRRQRVEHALLVQQLRIGVDVHSPVDRAVPHGRMRCLRCEAPLTQQRAEPIAHRVNPGHQSQFQELMLVGVSHVERLARSSH